MSENRPESSSAGISPADVYFILFRQKWIILLCALLGISGAAFVLFVLRPPQYQSQALISIRYVVQGKTLNPPGDQSNARPLDERTISIINTEIATLHSLDLTKTVVQAMTPGRILAKTGGGTDINRAMAVVSKGITIEALPESSVISITYQNADQTLVQPLLSEFIDAYLAKHVQTHEGLGVPNSFLTNETVRLSAELARTSDELRKIKTTAGVISVDGTEKSYADLVSTIRQDIFRAQADLSERQAILSGLTQTSAERTETTNATPAGKVPSDQIEKYENVCALLTYLRGKEQNYLTQQGFTSENVLVKQVRTQIVENDTLKKNLEQRFPDLLALNIPVANSAGQPAGPQIDFNTEAERVSALKAKLRVLNSQLNQVWADATNFEGVKTAILQLEQKRDVEEANLKYYQNNLEESRIDEALGPDKAANIKIIQEPSPPSKGWSKALKKKVAVVAAGGVMAGFALAFCIELFLDRSIKRPSEIENKLKLPLLISIPYLGRKGRRRMSDTRALLQDANCRSSESAEEREAGSVLAGDSGGRRHPLRQFFEGLRDRLVVYFEVRNLTHKPKLIGMTSCGKGAGVTSIATGLASALSETGEGNVLLVDMNVEGGAARYFHKGNANCGLDSALEAGKRDQAFVRENLYVAAEPAQNDQLPEVLPKRFANLVSRIKSSDYDYIIFDMPPVAETTITFRLARLMDMTLLVIESEKTNQEVVKRVTSLLAASKANVSTVLNKTRNYVPRRLHQEYLHDF